MAAENATKVVELMEVEAVLGKVGGGTTVGRGRHVHVRVAAACGRAPAFAVVGDGGCASEGCACCCSVIVEGRAGREGLKFRRSFIAAEVPPGCIKNASLSSREIHLPGVRSTHQLPALPRGRQSHLVAHVFTGLVQKNESTTSPACHPASRAAPNADTALSDRTHFPSSPRGTFILLYMAVLPRCSLVSSSW